jgi:hypothetical protein
MDRGNTLRAWGECHGMGGTGTLWDVARPGHPDLYCDVDAAYVQTLFRYESEFYLLLAGGRGWTTDPGTAAVREILPDELVESSFAYLPTDDQLGILDEVEGLLRRWSSDRTPVRLTCALWRVGALVAADGSFVPLPPL